MDAIDAGISLGLDGHRLSPGILAVINQAAYLFGIVFLLQSYLILVKSVVHKHVHFGRAGNFQDVAGMILILYALAVYPLTNFLTGHTYPLAPTFGVPCPTTIFTLGLLLFVKGKMPAALWIIPVLWSFVGFLAAWNLDMKEDFALPVAAVVFLIIQSSKNRHMKRTAAMVHSGRHA